MSTSPNSLDDKVPRRRMVRAELAGAHTHVAADGIRVHIWQRNGTYLVRGRIDGRQFGEGLGANEIEAAIRLRRVLSEIDSHCYVPPTARAKRVFPRRNVQRQTVIELTNDFLVEKLQHLGQKTTKDYRCRLTRLIEFAAMEANRKRWRWAGEIDREFAIQFRQFVVARRVTRNGRPSSQAVPISPGQVYNILDVVRTLLNWAADPRIGKLEPNFINPFDAEIVGCRPSKDPFRKPSFPIDRRIQIVAVMDEWQLSHLVLSLMLPIRPEDCTGLLIRDIDFEARQLAFGNRFQGRDFNKGKVSFVSTFPPEIAPLLQFCRGNRDDGPLLRRRAVFEGRSAPVRIAECRQDVDDHFANVLQNASPEALSNLNDQKSLIRQTIRQMGGISQDGLGNEFMQLAKTLWPSDDFRFYDLRGSISTDLDRAGVSYLFQRYITGHSTSDILTKYVSLDPEMEMQKYFVRIEPLLDAIQHRAAMLRLAG